MIKIMNSKNPDKFLIPVQLMQNRLYILSRQIRFVFNKSILKYCADNILTDIYFLH